MPAGRPLPAGWYQDPDRDFVPTAIEQEAGTDPAVDECSREIDCPGISEDAGVVRPEQGVNTMMTLDFSGSMRADAGGERKIDAAEEALERLATGTPDRYDLGLVVYGHVGSSAEADKQRSCAGVDTAGRLGEVDYRSLSDTLDRYEPRGYTPIARSIEEAGKAFAGRDDDVNRVVLVTDGLETSRAIPSPPPAGSRSPACRSRSTWSGSTSSSRPRPRPSAPSPTPAAATTPTPAPP